MKALALALLCACGSAPVDPVEDAQAADAPHEAKVPHEAGVTDVVIQPEADPVDSGTTPEADPPDVSTGDPNCVEATGCSDITGKCQTGPTWAYGEWANYCNRKTTTIVWACALPDMNKPACAGSWSGMDKYNVYWCCP